MLEYQDRRLGEENLKISFQIRDAASNLGGKDIIVKWFDRS